MGEGKPEARMMVPGPLHVSQGWIGEWLWVVLSYGSGERSVSADDLAVLVDDPQNDLPAVIFHYDWVPGSHEIAFDTRREIEGPRTSWSGDLRLVNVETGDLVTLLEEGEGGRTYYSPDGSKIAIITPQDISTMSADGEYRQDRVLEYPGVMTYSEYQYYPQPAWAADSQYLRVAIPFEDPLAEPPQPVELWHVPAPDFPVAGDSASDQATLLASVPAASFIRPPVAFSPDLRRIVYIQRTGDPQQNLRELHLAKADGPDDKVIQTRARMEFLGWSPDGEHYAFSIGDPQSGVIAGVDGALYPLSFNPDDLSWVDSESNLHVVSLGCAQELRLTNLDGESLVIDRMWDSPVSFDSVK
jgi:Tol biopolymer transport system component